MLRVSIVFGFLTLLSPAFAAPTKPLTPEDFRGTWLHAKKASETEQRMQAIEAATQDVPFFARKKARSRLRDATKPTPKIQIEVKDGTLQLKRGARTMNVKLGATPVEMSLGEQRAKIAARFAQHKLTVESRSEKGSRRTVFSLSEDRSTLIVRTRTATKKLKRPVEVRASYTRR